MAEEKATEVVVHDQSSVGLALAFFGLGTLVGATAALLLTTQSGADTREDIRRGFGELRERVTTLATQVRETADRVRTKLEEKRQAAPTDGGKAEEVSEDVKSETDEDTA